MAYPMAYLKAYPMSYLKAYPIPYGLTYGLPYGLPCGTPYGLQSLTKIIGTATSRLGQQLEHSYECMKFENPLPLPKTMLWNRQQQKALFANAKQHCQGRIQDFEMGGENIPKNQKLKYYFNIWGIREKKRKKGAQKKGGGGGENSPLSPPQDPPLIVKGEWGNKEIFSCFKLGKTAIVPTICQ